MSDWEELVSVAFLAALSLVGYIFLQTADISTVESGSQSIRVFVTAIILSIKPTGFSLVIDALAALASGVVSIRAASEHVFLAIFGFLFVYFALSISLNLYFVAPRIIG